MGGETTTSGDDDSWIMTQINLINEKFDFEEKFEKIKDFSTEHPVYTLFTAVTIAACFVPVICFLTFLFGTVIFGLISFVFFEGTILMISTVILGGVLCVTIVVACSISGFAVLSYYGVQFSYNTLKQTFPSWFEMQEETDSTQR